MQLRSAMVVGKLFVSKRAEGRKWDIILLFHNITSSSFTLFLYILFIYFVELPSVKKIKQRIRKRREELILHNVQFLFHAPWNERY